MRPDPVCPHCGGTVLVFADGRGLCVRCGPVEPVQAMAKVFEGGGPLLGQGEAARHDDGGWDDDAV